MDLGRFKKRQVSKETWLDWLSDAPPPASVQQEVRQKRVERANQYVRRDYTSPPGQVPQQPSTPPPTVAIHITMPELKWLHKAWAKLKDGYSIARQYISAYRRAVGLAAAAVVVLVLAVAFWPHPRHSNKPTTGSSQSKSAGSKAKLAQPDFKVYVPVGKPQLGTPDGKHSAFDGNRDSYSFTDSMQNNGFIVSEQPLPKAFGSGKDAVTKIAPTLMPNSKQESLQASSGTAALLTNNDNGAQSLVAALNDEVLIFIRSSHKFTADQWTTYINNLE